MTPLTSHPLVRSHGLLYIVQVEEAVHTRIGVILLLPPCVKHCGNARHVCDKIPQCLREHRNNCRLASLHGSEEVQRSAFLMPHLSPSTHLPLPVRFTPAPRINQRDHGHLLLLDHPVESGRHQALAEGNICHGLDLGAGIGQTVTDRNACAASTRQSPLARLIPVKAQSSCLYPPARLKTGGWMSRGSFLQRPSRPPLCGSRAEVPEPFGMRIVPPAAGSRRGIASAPAASAPAALLDISLAWR